MAEILKMPRVVAGLAWLLRRYNATGKALRPLK
jgi:hypothetical protein